MTRPGASLANRRLLTSFFFFLAALGLAGRPPTHRFNIPAAPAENSLKLLSVQSGRQVLFPTDAVEGIRTKAVGGEMTAIDALRRMLEGTLLVAVEDDETGSLTVRRKSSAAGTGKAGDKSTRSGTDDREKKKDQSTGQVTSSHRPGI